MKVNEEIRSPKVRLIDHEGKQIGIVTIGEARKLAYDNGMDLVEVVPTSAPPVCKVMDYGKFRYDQTKREKEGKKAQHQIKVKEIKLKPNIGEHDFQNKLKQARDFVTKGNKVKVTCTFRGREMTHVEIGETIVKRLIEAMDDIASPESPAKLLGRMLCVVMAPSVKKKKA